ncbi:MAG: NeuD/PglB/VioB family sugar acetyltransferase [Bacteroidota bacterium]
MRVGIIGAGGHSRAVINLAEHLNYEIEGIYDATYTSDKTEYICGYLLRGAESAVKTETSVLLAVGDNSKRKVLWEQFYKQAIKTPLVHPRAIIEKRVTLGKGNQVYANALMNNEVIVGDNNILNTGCILEHETHIGSHNHIAVGAILCGRVKIGDGCLIGAGAVINPTIMITNDVTVGAGAVVVSDILFAGVYVGNPAKKIK